MMTDSIKQGLGIADLIGDKREAVLQLAASVGAENVRVFGSVARGDAHEDSDIDFIVSFPQSVSIFVVVGLWQDLTELLGREVDLLTDHEWKDKAFKARVLKEAIPL